MQQKVKQLQRCKQDQVQDKVKESDSEWSVDANFVRKPSAHHKHAGWLQ